MTEEEFRQKVRQIAKLYGWEAYHTHRSDRSDGGWPDEVLCKPPRLLFVELKKSRKDGGKGPTPNQRKWLGLLEACGEEVALWRPEHMPTILRVLGPQGERAEWIES